MSDKYNLNWKVIEAYFEEKGLAEHQIDSYNDFINNGIQSIINIEPIITSKTATKEHTILVGDIYIDRPSIIKENTRTVKYITPQTARLKNIDYLTSICVNIVEIIKDENEEISRKAYYRVPVCKIPVMVKSCICHLSTVSSEELPSLSECPLDPGGYFIINGNERVIITQKRMNYNQVLVYKYNQSKQQKTKYIYYTETRSISEETNHSVEINAYFGTDYKSIHFQLPHMNKPVPVGIVFKALGFTEDDIPELIGLNGIKVVEKYIYMILTDSRYVPKKKKTDELIEIDDQKDAIEYLSKNISTNYYLRFIKFDSEEENEEEENRDIDIDLDSPDKKIKCVEKILDIEILPHLGSKSTHVEKGVFLAYMVNKLLKTVIGMRDVDNKDNISNKRYESTGILFTELFKSLYKKWVLNIKEQLSKKGQDVMAAISRNINITKNIISCMNTGNWAVKGNSYIRTGVSQILMRKNLVDMLSHLKRVVIPISREGKNTDIRQIDPSQIFFECPSETPEGEAAGIVTNLSITASTTQKIETQLVKDIVEEMPYFYSSKMLTISNYIEFISFSKVFINGILMGFTDEPVEFLSLLNFYREQEYIPYSVSFVNDRYDEEIRIFCDEGRLMRPIFTVKDMKLCIDTNDPQLEKNHFSWKYLLEKGYVVYRDSQEIEYSEIVMDKHEIEQGTQYCELHPTLMFGIPANIVPFGNYSPSPRMTYIASMLKQGIGLPGLSYQERTDTVMYSFNYPQKPTITTRISKIVGYTEIPAGTNVILAICTFMGNNVEDSIILNKSSVERGMFGIILYKSITVEEKKVDSYISESICLPPEKIRNHYNYSHLDKDGIVKKGTFVNVNDVIVGKMITKLKGTEKNEVDVSVAVKCGEQGTVDRVVVDNNPDGYKVVKVIIKKYKDPEIGDKFASICMQKGTVGYIVPQEDLHFNPQTGMVPDIIINPHAIPSRMTINLNFEMFPNKISCITGNAIDATNYHHGKNLIKSMGDEMVKLGYNRYGWETLCCGATGELLQSQIYMGPNYYQRLKHLVSEKMHCLTPDHQVLTMSGWKMITDITLQDKVAILDNGYTSFRNPIEIYNYPPAFLPIYQVVGDNVDLSVTIEHRMWCAVSIDGIGFSKYGFYTPAELDGKFVKYTHFSKNNIRGILKPPPIVSVKKFQFDSIAQLTGVLYSLWCKVNVNSKKIVITTYLKETLLFLASLFDDLNVEYEIEKINAVETDNIIVRDNWFRDFLIKFNIGENATLPRWSLRMSARLSEIMIKTIISGHSGKNETIFSTKSESLLDDLQILALNSEHSFSVCKIIRNDIQYHLFNLLIKYNNYTPLISRINYQYTSVHCLKVDSGVFLVRRNNKAVWTGNSRKSGAITSLTRQPVAGRAREGQSALKRCQKFFIIIFI